MYWTHVPEVLNVHMKEIYKKLTTIKYNKLKFKKVGSPGASCHTFCFKIFVYFAFNI